MTTDPAAAQETPRAHDSPVRRVLHVLNYAWPYIDGYTVRSMGVIGAQARHLGLSVQIAVSPFTPLATARDEAFRRDTWGPHAQIDATVYRARPSPRWQALERPNLGLAPGTSRTFTRELTSIVRRLEPDLIHVHHPHYVGRVALDVAHALGLPVVYELRCFNGDYEFDRRHPYVRLRGHRFNQQELAVCRRADAVVTIADGLARRIVASGVPRASVFVVRNSVDSDLFSAPAHSAPSSRQLTIGYACTLTRIEGLEMLVRAVAAANAQRPGRFQLRIAGTGPDYARIRCLVESLGLTQVVDLAGFIAFGEMPQFYQSLDLFVVPRLNTPVAAGTTPLKPLEALAAGLPLLVSELPALRELLGERSDAVFFEPEAPHLAEALLRFDDAPWEGTARVPPGRDWQEEIKRYRSVYTAAQQAAKRREPWRPSPLTRAGNTVRRHHKKTLRKAADRGWMGMRPLQRHVIVCGFPRTGSTLLQLMIECCVADVMTFPGEVPALWAAPWAARRHAYMLTKLPRDIAEIEAIRRYYRHNSGQAHFVLMTRDPRAVLTSTHDAYTSDRGYYVSVDRWQTIHERVEQHRRERDVSVLSYEELVQSPDAVAERLTAVLGWSLRQPFSRYHEIVAATGRARDSMTEGALGGLRPVERSRLARWQKPEHRERLRELLDAMPELPEHLIALGYEKDRSWLDELA